MRQPRDRHNEFRTLRQKAGLTRDEAAALVRVSDRAAYRYDNGTAAPSALALEVLREAAAKAVPVSAGPTAFRFIDLFAGIGGIGLPTTRTQGARQPLRENADRR